MRELIDRLALGMIDYENPTVETSVERIEQTILAGESCEGSFQIVNRGAGKLKGIVYSTDSHVKIKTKTFSGPSSIIKYTIDGAHLPEGSECRGEISIVSNGGELYLPFVITVHSKSISSSVGELKNLFHFADLVQKDYDEALRIFCSTRFPEILLREDYVLRAQYDALIQGSDKNIAMDEFLIVAKKKKSIHITTDMKERRYEDLQEDYQDYITLQKNQWGYLRVDVTCDGAFLELEKQVLTGQDFTGNTCQLSYVIHRELLAEGYNYATITIRSLQDELQIPVRVHRPRADGRLLKDSAYIQYKKHFAELYRCYLSFRMKEITVQEWTESTQKLIAKMRKYGQEQLFLQLLQAQLMVIGGKEVEARVLLDEISRTFENSVQKDVELYCYFLYVKAIQERKESVTKDAIRSIRNYYENGHDNWRLLWLLMYLDENYDRNESLKLIRMKEQYSRGMRSPLMYYESLAVFHNSPSLLRVLNEYERKVILFGIRRNYLSPLLIDRIVELCGEERAFGEDTYEILAALYDTTGRTEILEEIVTMLIKAMKTDTKYFCWYERAVRENLKLTGLYEYYMYAMPYDHPEPIPNVIFMYFVYNLSLKGERLDFLYQKVVEGKDTTPTIYEMYSKIIEKHAIDSVREGRINDKLAVVYREMLPRFMPSAEIAENLLAILNTYMITCENPAIREVVVIHKEMRREERVPFYDNKAYVQIFSEDAAIVFCDVHGNRYMQTVEYQMEHLVEMEALLKMCFEMQEDHLGNLIFILDQYLRYRKYQDKAISVMEKLVEVQDIREEYRAFLQKEMIEYYSIHSDEKEFCRYLMDMKVDKLIPATRAHVIQLCIIHGLTRRAFQLISIYGTDNIESKLILKCVNSMIEELEYDKSDSLLRLCMESFGKGMYNERILQYLAEYYYGSTRDMYRLWEAVDNFQCGNRVLDEKLVVQMLFTGEYGNHIGRVFEAYLQKGASGKIKRAYLIRKSYDYFVKQAVIDDKVFEHIKCELGNGEEVHYLCELAYLNWQSEKEQLDKAEAEECQKILQELCLRGKKFEFFKKFRRYFALPQSVENHTILEYRTLPDCEVWIHYYSEEAKDYMARKMRNVCHGIYTAEFVLFYGESLKYYITVDQKGERNVTESTELTLSREHGWKDNSNYGVLNNLMVCCEMQEDETLSELAVDYYVKKKLNKSIFMIS